jgi:hypothetical protein
MGAIPTTRERGREMIEHHFIITYSKERGWEWDTDSEASRYQEGTVWDTESKSWSVGYLGEGEYLDDDDLVGEQLGAILEIANSASKVI